MDVKRVELRRTGSEFATSVARCSGVEVIAIGTELLLGATVDGNGAWLGRRLAEVGVRVGRLSVVGDDDGEIRDAVSGALARTGLVICTGGLGPTRDDVTRPAVASLFGRGLVVDDAWLDVVRERFRRRGLDMPEVNRTQAEVPEGARLLPNARGTAPGIIVEGDIGTVVLLPGVPHEMRGLTERFVIPYLRDRGAACGSPVASRVIRTTGISESALAERVGDLADRLAPLTLAYLPSLAGEDVRVTCWGDIAESDAGPALNRAEAMLRDRLDTWVYGTDDDDLAAIVGCELRERGLSIAIAESCTGGLLAKRLTDAAGASDFLIAGIVVYADASKSQLLGVRNDTLSRSGAVSEAVALEMAQGVRGSIGSDVAVAITGIAGPGGATPDKPVGTVWAAVATADGAQARLFRLAGSRAEIRERAAQAALAWLRQHLRGGQ